MAEQEAVPSKEPDQSGRGELGAARATGGARGQSVSQWLRLRLAACWRPRGPEGERVWQNVRAVHPTLCPNAETLPPPRFQFHIRAHFPGILIPQERWRGAKPPLPVLLQRSSVDLSLLRGK